jgi:gamma-glutamyltranspeptidase/glutathione hydrolase
VLQVILNILESKMDVDATVSLPCIHHQWLPDELRANGWGLDALTLQDLHLQGHKIKETAPLG